MSIEECLLILGLEKAYSDKQLKTAYRNSALVWHPDRFQSQNEDLRKRAEKEMQRVNEAYQSLKSNRFTSSYYSAPPTNASTSHRTSPPPPPRNPTPPPPRTFTEPTPSSSVPPSDGRGNKNFSAAIVLTLFLGVIGVDRFYLGYYWSGLFKTFTYGGFGIMAIIDWYRIFTKRLQPRHGKYVGSAKPAVYVLLTLVILGVLFKVLGIK